MLGIVAGTVFLKEPLFRDGEQKTVETIFGSTAVIQSKEAVYLPRHGVNENYFILPHMINHQANMQALKDLGVSRVISVCSTGSLKGEIKPGHIVVPHDFIALSPTPTLFHDQAVHVPPVLDEYLREQLITATRARLEDGLHSSAIYWQTAGPRFETRAEIGLMANFAHIVGMTMASEVVICCELGLPCAAICSVDNYAHGIGDDQLSAESVQESARRNAASIADILKDMAVRPFPGTTYNR